MHAIEDNSSLDLSSQAIVSQPTRRHVLKGGAACMIAAGLHGSAFAQCSFVDSEGLPVYWNGWRVLNDNSTNPSAGTFSSTTCPAAACRDGNHLDVFVIGNDSKVWTNSWVLGSSNSSWGGWNQIPGGPFSNLTAPAVVARDASHLDVFVIGNDSKLWTNCWNGSWAGWVQIAGGPFSNKSAPVAVARDSSHIDLFVVGNDGNIWFNEWAGSWGGWFPVGSGSFAATSSPAVVSRSSVAMDLFAMGTDGKIYTSEFTGSWSSWTLVTGGPFLSGTSPIAVARDSSHMDLFVSGNDDQVWTNSWAGSWAGWNQLSTGPGTVRTPAAAALDTNNMSVFAVAGDGRTWSNKWQASGWCGWSVVSDNPNAAPVSALSAATAPVALRRDNTHIELLTFGTDTRVWRNTWGAAAVVYVPLSAMRLSQETANYDPTGLKHINNTANWAVSGTDMGCPVEFNGRLYLLFGDIPTTNPVDLDPICYTTDATLVQGGFHLSCITGSTGQFSPMTVDGAGMGTNETATGAFTYNSRLYAFVVRGNSSPYSTLVSTADPATSTDFKSHYNISTSTGLFWQIAPWVIQNASWPGLPSNSGDGLLMWGQSGSSIYLAWMPLTPGVNPPAGIQYYAHGKWSTNQTDASPIFATFGITQISVTWLAGPQRWLFLYTRASTVIPHESIVARLGTNPWTWSDEVVVFNPDREQAWGNYMHVPQSDSLYELSPPRDPNLPGYAYSPFLLNRYTSWNASTRKLLITYLMATFVPYQVMLMQASLQIE